MADEKLSSRSWKLDLTGGRLAGEIDGAEALKQAVMIALSVPRYEHLIFSDQFGHELDGLIGRDPDYIEAAAPGLIADALLPDDRVAGIGGLTLETEADSAKLTFTVLAEETGGTDVTVTAELEGGK